MVVLAQAILFLVCLLVFLFCWGWRWVTYAPRIMEMVVHCLWFVNGLLISSAFTWCWESYQKEKG